MGGLRRSMPVTFVVMTDRAGRARRGAAVLRLLLEGRDPRRRARRRDRWWTGATVVRILVVVAGFVTVGVDRLVRDPALAPRVLRRLSRRPGAPHDPPPLMRWPVIVLAVPAALLGFAGLSAPFAQALDGPATAGPATNPGTSPSVISLALVVIGVVGGLGDVAPVDRRTTRPGCSARRARSSRTASTSTPCSTRWSCGRSSRSPSLVKRADSALVDGAVEGTAAATMRVGGWVATWHRGARSPGRRGRARWRAAARHRRRDRGWSLMAWLLIAVLALPAVGAVVGGAHAREKSRAVGRYGCRGARPRRRRDAVVVAHDTGHRGDPAVARRRLLLGARRCRCGSTSVSTASRTPWWC